MIWIVLLLVAVVGFALVAPALSQVTFGQHLTNMTTVFEDIERTRYTMPIGQGGGVDSLSPNQARRAEIILQNGMVALRKQPRHVVTRELIKNYTLAKSMGRYERMVAIDNLMKFLVREGIALGADEFNASYA